MKKLQLLTALLLMLVLAACGGGGDEGGSETAAPQNYNLTWEFTNEFSFSPDSVGVPAGSTVTVDLDNTGASVAHSWILVEGGVLTDSATPEEIEAAAVSDRANSGEVAGGDTAQMVFKAPDAPGDYEFVCAVAGHLVGGMRGDFTVTE